MLGQQNSQRPLGGGADKRQHNYRPGRQEKGKRWTAATAATVLLLLLLLSLLIRLCSSLIFLLPVTLFLTMNRMIPARSDFFSPRIFVEMSQLCGVAGLAFRLIHPKDMLPSLPAKRKHGETVLSASSLSSFHVQHPAFFNLCAPSLFDDSCPHPWHREFASS